LTTDQIPAHTHTISGESNYNSNRTNCGITKYTTRAEAGTKSTGAAGESKAHNNMPPYLTVYMWKKTAQ
jgi:microcystin-dependent protein